MPEFTGKVVNGKASVYKAVKGDYEVDDYEPGEPWKGRFEVTSGEIPFIEDDGELILDNGLRGKITITRVTRNDIVEFNGEGQLTEDKESSFA